MSGITLYHGDCLAILPTIPDGLVDAIVSDPPAGIAFMNKSWDNPANYPISLLGLSDGGNRRPIPTIGRSSSNGTCRKCGRRERGWKDVEPCRCLEPNFDEVERRFRDRDYFIAFLSTVMAECFRVAKPGARALVWAIPRTSHWTGTAIEDAGWIIEDRIAHHFGQGYPKHKSKLKPATEDWWLAWKLDRKATPLNIDACRIGVGDGGDREGEETAQQRYTDRGGSNFAAKPGVRGGDAKGRWPANAVFSHHPECCPVGVVKVKTGTAHPGSVDWSPRPGWGNIGVNHDRPPQGYAGPDGREPVLAYECVEGCLVAELDRYGDTGSASRFFYCSKADRADRGPGNDHPTCKNTDLMRWLCRLITPPGGTILDPFMGSGSTGVAARLEGFGFVGIEESRKDYETAVRRLNGARMPLFEEPLEA